MFLIIAKQLQKNLQLKKTGICMLQMLNKSARQTAIYHTNNHGLSISITSPINMRCGSPSV